MSRRMLLTAGVIGLAVAGLAGTATAGIDRLPSADVGVTISAANSAVAVGSPVTYTLTATNAGAGGAVNVTLTDLLPAGMTVLSATQPATWWQPEQSCEITTVNTGNQYTDQAGTVETYTDPTGVDMGPYAGRTLVTCDVGGLGASVYNDPTDTATIEIVAVPTAAATLTNEAQVGARNADPYTPNNYAWSTVTAS